MHRRRLIPLLTAAVAALALTAPAAHAGNPVIVPVKPASTDLWAVDNTTVQTNPSVQWLPGLAENPPSRAIAVTPKSHVYLIGDPYVNFPVVWEDVGSGAPTPDIQGSNGFSFPLAGEYPYHCAPTTVNVCGLPGKERRMKVWVIGPRPILTPTLASPDNITTPVLYKFDASGSFVTDFTAHNIVEYAYDFTSDGTWDQVSPDPLAQAALDPGDQVVTLQVKDDIGRVAAIAMAIQVPKARSAPPAPTPADTSLAGSNVISGVKFPKANVRIKTKKKIKVTALKRKGLVVRVTGLTKGDTVNAKVLNRKKKTVGSGKAKAKSSALNVRIKVGKKGRKLLKLKQKVTRMVVSVTASGEDGFSITKRAAVRVSR